jgi:MHS family proline/betaine transporter-like MFS transporter
MIITATVLMTAVAWPLFLWLHRDGGLALVCTQSLLAVLLAVLLGSCPATFVEMFPERDRLSGYSVSYNIGLGIFGGATPMICTALIEFTGDPWPRTNS